jgi:hypothetical protein
MDLFTCFVLFLFSSIGLTHIMVDSSIMLPFRNFVKEKFPDKILWIKPKEGIECYQCMGFWCGLVCGAMISVMVFLNPWFIALTTILCGFASSYTANTGAYVIAYLEANSVIDIQRIRRDD